MYPSHTVTEFRSDLLQMYKIYFKQFYNKPFVFAGFHILFQTVLDLSHFLLLCSALILCSLCFSKHLFMRKLIASAVPLKIHAHRTLFLSITLSRLDVQYMIDL